MPAWERLSALDATFLGIEDGNSHMHVGAVMLFEPGPLVGPDGRLDIGRIRRAVEAKLHLVPRYRQKLAYVPMERHPVWVDDDRFNLEYHVRLTALPYPGDLEKLKRLTGRIMSQMLDRGKPLWEMWCVEGMENGGFAMIMKTHHCMVDGVSGSDIIVTLLDRDPSIPPGRPKAWRPRPAPHGVNLTADALRHRLEQPVELLRAGRRALRHPLKTVREATTLVQSVADIVRPGLQKTTQTPFNVAIGPHRRLDWLSISLDEVKGVKNVLGGTVNDVVLAAVAGGVREFMKYRRVPLKDMEFRVMIPVSVRSESERGTLGNRVAAMVARLPLEVADPADRIQAVTKITQDLKQTKQAVGAERLTALAEWTVPNVLAQATRLATRARAFNMVVTNVPGPQVPLYLDGARMQTAYPLVPLIDQMAVGVALFSYAGNLYWGINSDSDAVPDTERFVHYLQQAFDELKAAAQATAEANAPPKPRTKRKRQGARKAVGGKGRARKTA